MGESIHKSEDVGVIAGLLPEKVGVTENPESSRFHDFFPEGEASYTLAEAIRENRLGGGLKDFARRTLWISLSYLISGWYQYQGEIYKVTGVDAGEDPLKFTGGVESISFPEELIEAGTSAGLGAIGMLYFAKFMRNREGERLSTRDEAIAVVVGSFLGNAVLSALGGLAHELVGRPDFPTMEIIQKVLGN